MTPFGRVRERSLAIVAPVVLVALLRAPRAEAARYRTGPPAAWVTPVPVPLDAHVPAGSAKDGLEFLLFDRQVLVAGESRFTHVARRYLNDAGVKEGSELSFEFDPSFESLTLHFIRLHRGGATVDAWNRARVSVLQRETDLERKMFDGSLSVVAALEDVRVGDVLEYAYSVTGKNPVLAGRFQDSVSLAWSVPLARLSHRVLCPTSRRLTVTPHGPPSAPPVMETRGSVTEYRWSAEDVPAVAHVAALPSDNEIFPWVQLSDWESWSAVAAWARPLYKKTRIDPRLVKELARETPAETVTRALRFVEDDVRYLGIELGAGSFVPRDPATVLRRRFGDCKDKALLLTSLLSAEGIDAVPALVNTRARHALAAWAPTATAFDHVVVRVRLDGKTFWLDPTRDHQGGRLGEIFFSDLGWALPLAADVTALEEVPHPDPERARRHVCERFVIPSFDRPADLLVTTTYVGVRADQMRRELSQESRQELAESYRKFYVSLFPKTEIAAPLAVDDDRDANVLVLSEAYRIADLFESGKDDFRKASFYPQEIRDHLPAPPDPKRKEPLALVYPDHLVEEMEIVLPHDWKVKPQDDVILDDGLLYRYTSSYASRVLRLRWEVSNCARRVAPEGIATYAADLRKIIDGLGEELTWTPAKPAPPRPEPKGLAALHLPVIGTTAFASMVLIALGAFVLTRRAPALSRPIANEPPPLLSEVFEKGPEGLGGWLLLVGFGVCLRPFLLLAQMSTKDQRAVFLKRTWEVLTQASSPAYKPFWAPLLIGELLVNLALLVFSVVLLIAFFAKKRTFPVLFIAFIVTNILFLVVDGAAASLVVENAPTSPQLGSLLPAAMVWIPYMLRSKRVKATFVR